MDPFRNGAAGVVSSAKLFRPEDFAELTTITASRYRARASRPSAALRWLRNFDWCRSLPLLCEEGNSARFYVSQFFHRPYDRRYSRLWLKLALMGASPGIDFRHKTSREAAAELRILPPLRGWDVHAHGHPALARWAMFSRRFAAWGNRPISKFASQSSMLTPSARRGMRPNQHSSLLIEGQAASGSLVSLH
jgi:hypothetical protein